MPLGGRLRKEVASLMPRKYDDEVPGWFIWMLGLAVVFSVLTPLALIAAAVAVILHVT